MKVERACGYDVRLRYHVRKNGVVRAGFVDRAEAEEWAQAHGGEVWEAARNPRMAGRDPRYTDREQNAIAEAALGGKSYRKVAAEFGCSIGYVHKLISERRKNEHEKNE